MFNGSYDDRTKEEIIQDELLASQKKVEEMAYEALQIQRYAAGLSYDKEFLDKRNKK